MCQAARTLVVQTRGAGLVEITREVAAWAAEQGMTTGLLTVFCRHTSTTSPVAGVQRDVSLACKTV